MKKIYALLLILIWLGCTGQALIEVGMNDAALLAGVFGDLSMNVSKIEIAQNGDYSTIWEGNEMVTVAIQSSDYVSITNDLVDVTPGTYRNIRITVDSLRYVDDTIVMLREQSFEFVAEAFTNISIEENDDLQLVVLLNTSNWLDLDTIRIVPGKTPFEGAALRIQY